MNAAAPVRSRWLRRARCASGFAVASFVSAFCFATPLVQVNATTYKTEHCLFIIDSSVTWSSPTTAYNDLYAAGVGPVYFPKLAGYFSTLTTLFPGNYFSVCYIANTGASNVPSYINRTYKATGISNGAGSSGIGAGSGATPGTYDAVDFCRYNLPGGNLISPALAVFDHEIGHAWGAQIFYTLNPPMLANGHWLPNSTVNCQLGSGTSTDGYITVNKIYGDPVTGFRWQRVDNARSNDTAVFSEQTLYLMGVSPTFPTSYVLNNPVFNADHTTSSSSVDTFDHATAVSTYGVRNPDYKTSPKKFKLGFVYVARDLAEVNTVYQTVEQSINSFCNDETISTTTFRSQTPFLCDARYRASVDGLLADLDGNTTPAITITNAYVSSTDGTASVSFCASDADGGTPAVSVVPASPHASVSGSTVNLSGLPDGVHFFTLKAGDAGGKKALGHFVVEVHRPSSSTSITTSPTTRTVTAGASATFSLSATGTPSTLTYQWYRQVAKTSTWSALADGGAYSGANSATLTVNSAPIMDGDQFLCFVSNSTGAATSAAATLVVNETTPVITSEAADQYVTANTSTYFRITAGGSGTFGYYYYQWQRLPAGSATWTDLVAGSTYSTTDSSQLSISGTTLAMTGDQFRCVVSDSAGNTTSAAATLHVGVAPQIIAQPLPVTANAGDTVTYSVTASGTGPLVYQWSKYGTPVGNAATLTLTNVQASDAAVYGVIVTNPYGLAYSNNVSLTVNAAVPVPPAITTQPQSQNVTTGATVNFTVAATGTPTPTYQWSKDGGALGGATSATLTLSNVQSGNAGSYSVAVTNSSGSATSNPAVLTVTAPPVAPAITAQPQSLSTTAGQNVSFSVLAMGSAPLSYQWRKNSVAIAGATSATLALTSVQAGDAADYTVVVTNAVNNVASAAATLTVVPAPSAPVIASQPASQTVTAGQPVVFTVSVSGTAPFTYQWRKGGIALPSATAATLSLLSSVTTDAGDYTVVVTNSLTSVSSAPATLVVLAAAIAPAISSQPQSLTTTAGQSVTFTVAAGGTGPLAYQWLKDGVVIGGTSGATLTLTDVQSSSAGDYVVTVSNSAGAISSTVAHLTVSPVVQVPIITEQPASVTVVNGGDATFSVTATGATSYLWQYNGVPLTGATGTALTLTHVQAANAGNYAVSVSNAAGSVTSATATLTISAEDYSGMYTGAFGADRNAGEFALLVNRDGTAWLLARITGSVKSAVLAEVAIQANGTFSVASAEGAFALGTDSTRFFTGQITGRITTGSVALNVPAANFTGTAARSAAPAIPGLHAAAYEGLPIAQSSGEVYVLIGEGGEAFLLELAASAARTGAGSATGDGRVQVSVGTGAATSVYAGTVSSTGFRGTVTTAGSTVSLSPPPSAPGKQRLINISSRGLAGTGDKTMIAGFVISGNQAKDILVRVLGPALIPLGVTTALTDPKLKLLRGSQTILENDDWGSAGADIASTTARLGGYPLTAGSRDSAVLTRLSPGLYSAQVSSATSGAGVAIVEVYDAGPTDRTEPKVVNISTRAGVGRGDEILIAGFVVTGDAPKQVLLRAVGPTLANYGVSGALADPLMKVFQGSTFIRENDNWSDSADAALIAAAAATVGAAPLPVPSKDACLLLYLEPGVYSVHVRGVADTTGIALVEVYEVTD